MQKDIITISLSNEKILVLNLTPFDSEIDIDDLIQIHHHNIVGEIYTCPVLLNRVGNLLAEMDSILAEGKLDFDIFYAQQEERYRKELTVATPTKTNANKVEIPTNTAVEQAIIRTPEYKVKKRHIITLQKNRDIINSWYWAIKDKSEKVSKITDKLRPEDFEKDIIEETINTVQIKIRNKTIKSIN